jgi:hypothetical protein
VRVNRPDRPRVPNTDNRLFLDLGIGPSSLHSDTVVTQPFTYLRTILANGLLTNMSERLTLWILRRPFTHFAFSALPTGVQDP